MTDISTLATQIVQALQPLLFRSRTRLTPARLREIAQQIAQDYQQALTSEDGHQAQTLGESLAKQGLHPDMLFAVADVLYRHGCHTQPAGAYIQTLLKAFIAQRERLLKQELEASIQALRRRNNL